MADTETPSTEPAEGTPETPAEGAPATPAAEGTPAEGTPAEEAAPWGDDFDAERAWRLVQNLRTEKDEIKAERDRLKSPPQEGKEKASATEKLTAAEARAKEAERALYLERVYRAHPELDSDDFRDFLTGDTEEEIKTKAERLARLGKPKDGDQGDKPDQSGATPPGKPTPSLVPGHGGEEAPVFDPVAIAKKARR